MGRGQAQVADAFSQVMGHRRGATGGALRETAGLTTLPDRHEEVMRAFARGGMDGLESTPVGSVGVIWAVPRGDGSDDAFLSLAAQRSLVAARVDGRVTIVGDFQDFWKEAAEAIRLICLDEGVPCGVEDDGELGALKDEYRSTYTPEETSRLLTSVPSGDDVIRARINEAAAPVLTV